MGTKPRTAAEAAQIGKRRRQIGEAIFWLALGLAASGTLRIASRDGEPVKHHVQVNCATGDLLDVLNAGAADGPKCYAIEP